MADLGDYTYDYDSTYHRFRTTITDKKTGYALRTQPFMCSIYQIIDDGRAYDDVPDYSLYNGSGNYIHINDSRYTNGAELKTAITGQSLEYELANPIKIQLTPAVLNLMKEYNIITTDGDNVQIKYSKIPNGNLSALVDYVRQLEARVAALES